MRRPERKPAGLGPLADGATAVVIGGGPGGVATALALLQGARALGREVHVTLVEGKLLGSGVHHNQCAGVLSPPIATLLHDELGLTFPDHLSRAEVKGYVLHTARRQVVLDGDAEPSVALRRVHFDGFMLGEARQRGVHIVAARVTDLEFHAGGVTVYTDTGPLEADVVVGAFGLDPGTAAPFTHTVGYRPPPALTSVVTKYHPGEAGMAAFGERIHAFLPAAPGIEFGAIIPKGNHLTISIAGIAADAALMDMFLCLPEVRAALPCLENAGRFDRDDLRYFKGRFPRGLAGRITGDRYVMVGDAAGLVRAFKGKGITSAVQTGVRAARVILQDGISARALQAYAALNHDILTDLPYGRVMRRLTIMGARLGLLDPVLKASERDAGLRQALFDAVSAHREYRAVVQRGLSRSAVSAVLRALVQR